MVIKEGLENGQENTLIGVDPRKLSPDDLIALGHNRKPILQALRERCVDCCGGSVQEVRLCTAVACAAWPFRMGTDPWRAKVVLSEDKKNLLRDRLAASRAAKRAGAGE